ncbi:MAG: FAD-dependent oxidoreductase [Prolixibacteraceae bacterium]|nr:FAD-dependent oxidoreductase [Prolixibacteraceae bacterium]
MVKYLISIKLLFLLSLSCYSRSFDVVVYGATPAGITAAIAASREGKSVVIVEPLPLVGGIMSGGLSFSDSNQMARETLGGIFEEFHKRVETEYINKGIKLPYQVSEKDTRPWTYEPHVAEKVFSEILKEASVLVVLNETLKSVDKKENYIVALNTYSKKRFSAKVFIDASYEGDLLAAAKVGYRVGREGRDEYDESLAGATYPKNIVSVSATNDKNVVLPLISGNQKAPEGQGDQRIMTYSFRLCLSADPNNQIPFRKPKNYDPELYELFRRYYKIFPETRILFDMYPIPGNKFDGNNGIGLQLSMGLVGENWDYPEAKPEKRKEIWKLHKDYTEGLLYFLMTDSSVPENIRNRMEKLGYAKDEFQSSDHFPPVLYVREGRRMVGDYVLTQSDILENIEKPAPIGIGSFPIDSHDCQRIAINADAFLNEGTIFPVHIKNREIGQPYQIPYRSITPKENECANLLVPVCLSASHVAFSSIRVEPAWMILGESAGVAASLAIDGRTSVQKINYKQLAKKLEEKGQILELQNNIIQ